MANEADESGSSETSNSCPSARALLMSRAKSVTVELCFNSAHTAARAAPPAPITAARKPLKESNAFHKGSINPPASVLKPRSLSSSIRIVLTAPISFACVSIQSRCSSTADLCGAVTLNPRKFQSSSRVRAWTMRFRNVLTSRTSKGK